MVRPFRAQSALWTGTQGVALGWYEVGLNTSAHPYCTGRLLSGGGAAPRRRAPGPALSVTPQRFHRLELTARRATQRGAFVGTGIAHPRRPPTL